MMLTKNSSFGGEHLHFYGWHELELWSWKEDQLLASSIVVRTFPMDGGPLWRTWLSGQMVPTSHLPIWHWAPGGGDGCAAGESPVSTLRALRCWVRVGPAGGSEDGLTPPTREARFLHARPTKQHFTAHWTQKQMNRSTCLPLSQTLKKFLSKKVLPSDSLFVVAVWKIQVISHNIMLYMWTWWFCCYF